MKLAWSLNSLISVFNSDWVKISQPVIQNQSRREQTSLASFDCCPTVDHVKVPWRIISLKFKHILVKWMNNFQINNWRIPSRASHDLQWQLTYVAKEVYSFRHSNETKIALIILIWIIMAQSVTYLTLVTYAQQNFGIYSNEAPVNTQAKRKIKIKKIYICASIPEIS